MAHMDLLSYERDSRWMPHLSWTYPEWASSPDRKQQQAAQRELAWQKIADKLGPLLIGGGGNSNGGGVASEIGGSFGHSDYVSLDLSEDQEHLERAYEKAPLLSATGTNIRNSSSSNRNARSSAAQAKQLKQQQQHLMAVAQHSQGEESQVDSQTQSEEDNNGDSSIRVQPVALRASNLLHQEVSANTPISTTRQQQQQQQQQQPKPLSQQQQQHKPKYNQNHRRHSHNHHHQQIHNHQILDSAHLHYLEAAKSRNCGQPCTGTPLGMEKFKAYQQQMEKALRAFEYTTEWADLVNALGKVNKVLANYSQFSKIPCDAILGRRLAQCLHPGLPNGVQLKALETYDLLFKAIGSDNLMQELSKFSNGLFPLLSHADLNVKPALLGLYELHFLPLNERLRPALDGFLIATLHGLEENTDFYQRTDDLLLRVCAGVGPEHFYGSLWRCILIDPSVRLHGMNFLIAHFNKKRPLEDQLHILGNSFDALTEAICVSLLDIRNVLVQRAALDLLLCCLPLHNTHIVRNDMIKLATGAVTVLLRRDTSLSRRLLAWIFNLESNAGKKVSNLAIYHQSQSSGNHQSQSSTVQEPRKSREQREKERKITYFDEFAKPLLLEAFNNCLSDPSRVIDIPNCWSGLGDYWSYRLLICLIDHSELCELIIDDICLDILRALCLDFRREENQRLEFTRTIKLLLTSMNVSYLWNRVYTLMAEVCQERRRNNGSPDNENLDIGRKDIDLNTFYVQQVGAGSTNVLELCSAFNFMMECFPIENYIEIAKEFLPRILINLLDLMIDYCDILKVDEYFVLTKVVANIFEGVNTLHRVKTLLTETELARITGATSTGASGSQVPPPLGMGQISLVTEDDEYLAEEGAGETSNDNPNGDDSGEKSLADSLHNNNNQAQLSSSDHHLDDSSNQKRQVTIDLLIEKFHNVFHSFVARRLLKHCEMQELYDKLALLLGEKHLTRGANGPPAPFEQRITINSNLTEIHESLCGISTLIATIPVNEDAFDPRGPPLVPPNSTRPEDQSNSMKSPTEDGLMPVKLATDKVDGAPQQQGNIANSTLASNAVTVTSTVTTTTGTRLEGQAFDYSSSCRPYIKDLMLLSCAIDNIKVNHLSMNLLLGMLSPSKLSHDLEFARANQPVETVVPTFSEELNASVVGDTPLMYERRSSESEQDTADSPKRLLLTTDEFYFITEHSCWFSMAMEVLWQYLSSEPMLRLETVDIIQNMHNLTYQTLVCEDVICASLNSGDEKIAYEARQKFILLFSLMKNDRSTLDLKQREFERPLFFMLDSLANKMDPFNCIARNWLTQVYKFKTTARVLEPILRILLHPDTARTPIIFTKINISSIHHTHMHLYGQVYDSQRILYALNTLWNVLTTDPHQGLIRMANSSVGGCHELHTLYARHNNAQAGGSFHDEVTLDSRASQAPSFLELAIITCLNFLSSHYMMLPSVKLSQADIHGNQKVRMLSCEILRAIFGNLFDAIKGCPTQPIHDMLNRCKAQEIVLLHVAISVQCAQHNSGAGDYQNQQQQQQQHQTDQQPALSSEQLIHYNETSDDNPDDFQRTLLRLLEALMILEYRVAPPNVISETENHSRSARTRDIPDISSNSLKYFYNILISSQRLFLAAVKAALQNIQRSDLHVNWLSMIETTLPISGRSLTRWIGCVIARLCENLELISQCVLANRNAAIANAAEPTATTTASINLTMTPRYLLILMNSLSHLTHHCLLDSSYAGGSQAGNLSQRSESLSTLLPSTMNALSSSSGVNSGSTTTLTSAGTGMGPSSLGPVSHVMSNIFHVFSNDQGSDSGIGGSQSGSGLGQNDPILVARREVLNKLSQIIFAIIQVWKAMSSDKNSLVILGAPADVKKQILVLLSPISLRHGVQFMNAVAFVWHELRAKNIAGGGGGVSATRKDVIPPCSADQCLLVEIVASISDLPMESVLQTTRQVISKAQESRDLRRAPLEVGLLQFFLAYIRLFPGSQLIECWKPLLHLLRDGLQLGRPAMPQAQFTLLALLHEFVQTAPLIEDRKDQKDLQDVAQRLIDSLIAVVKTRFTQTRWLRGALEVEPGPQHEISEDDDACETTVAAAYSGGGGPRSLQPDAGSIFSGESRSSEHFTDADSAITTTGASMTVGPTSLTSTTATGGTSNQISGSGGSVIGSSASATAPISNQNTTSALATSDDNNVYLARYSVQALNAMAEYMAPVLDVVYASDEKEKVVNLINGIMCYVNPYLKNHHAHNSPSFLACSHLLSSISGYQYTRKAWRKDALELLLDPQFFQMRSQCLEHWRVIVDHLMTHDKTTFRDFLSRMSLNQSGGALKLFASRDQESEQRAQLIKRMAFILFCSERDQYHKYTPEIQEKLIESLRDNPSDLVQSQIMLCFRVLIIRSSAHLLTSLWPFVYTEMVQGLLDIESYLEQNIAASAAAVASQQAVSAATSTGSSAPNETSSSPSTVSLHSTPPHQNHPPNLPAGLQISPSTAARFQLFLYTCKLLDMVLALPADSLPQFQMYRWSFIGGGHSFEPHLVRIERRLTELSQCRTLLPYRNHYPVLTLSKINNLLDLHPFFKTLVKVNRNEYEWSEHQSEAAAASQLSPSNYDDPIKFIDAILESDFLVQ